MIKQPGPDSSVPGEPYQPDMDAIVGQAVSTAELGIRATTGPYADEVLGWLEATAVEWKLLPATELADRVTQFGYLCLELGQSYAGTREARERFRELLCPDRS